MYNVQSLIHSVVRLAVLCKYIDKGMGKFIAKFSEFHKEIKAVITFGAK